ncbi:hypothetical protein ACI4A9_28925, partial [Klebsiella pneumoniae]|uniref:hypothetical protein n=1 Tax=Klebsiella pneumoniae TaxID=573 RepID=UPI003851CFC6
PDWAALFAEAQKEGRATIDLETVGKRWLHFRIFPDQHESCSIFVQDATVQKGLELNQLQMLAAERHARS